MEINMCQIIFFNFGINTVCLILTHVVTDGNGLVPVHEGDPTDGMLVHGRPDHDEGALHGLQHNS